MWAHVTYDPTYDMDSKTVFCPLSFFKDFEDVVEELKTGKTRDEYLVFWSPFTDDNPEQFENRQDRLLANGKIEVWIRGQKPIKGIYPGYYRAKLKQWAESHEALVRMCYLKAGIPWHGQGVTKELDEEKLHKPTRKVREMTRSKSRRLITQPNHAAKLSEKTDKPAEEPFLSDSEYSAPDYDKDRVIYWDYAEVIKENKQLKKELRSTKQEVERLKAKCKEVDAIDAIKNENIRLRKKQEELLDLNIYLQKKEMNQSLSTSHMTSNTPSSSITRSLSPSSTSRKRSSSFSSKLPLSPSSHGPPVKKIMTGNKIQPLPGKSSGQSNLPAEGIIIDSLNTSGISYSSVDTDPSLKLNDLCGDCDSDEDLIIKDESKESLVDRVKVEPGQMMIGGRAVDKTCVDRIDSFKGVSKYTSALCSIVFTQEELQTSSLTGSSCNYHKGRESIKKQLAPEVVQGLIAFVEGQFPPTDRSQKAKTKKAIEAAIRTKCNNAAAALRRMQHNAKCTMQQNQPTNNPPLESEPQENEEQQDDPTDSN